MDDTDEAMGTPLSGSSIGDAVSARGLGEEYEEAEEVEDDDDGLYYIPERRPSLDLGPSPMNMDSWHKVEQALSPAQSYSTMASEEKFEEMEEDKFSTSVQLERAGSYSSCYSVDSDDCEKKIPKTGNKKEVQEKNDSLEFIQDPDELKHPSLTVSFTFKAICETLGKLDERDLWLFKRMLWKYYPQSFNTSPHNVDLVDLVDRLLERHSLEVSLVITKTVIDKIGRRKVLDHLSSLCRRNEVRYQLCQDLKKKYEVCEDFGGETRRLDDIFVNLDITTLCNHGPNIEHEVLKIDKLNTCSENGTALSIHDIMRPDRLEITHIKFVLLTGIAGSGKSMAIRKLIFDWIEERSLQHLTLLFPLPFKELKQHFGDTKVSLSEILKHLYPATEKLKEEDFTTSTAKVMFIVDGLDEFAVKFDFLNTGSYHDIKKPASLDKIVVNLLRGKLLYHGLLLITTRPLTETCVPFDVHYNEVQVLGFRDPERDEYFRKRFKNQSEAQRVIEHINTLKTLRIMCHLPLFCSLLADELQCIFRQKGIQAELPKTITYMYTKFMLALMNQHRRRKDPETTPDQERDFLMKLGKLAFSMLEQGIFKISTHDWNTDIDHVDAVVNTSLCTQFLTRPYILSTDNCVSFIHPTMQEYLAALYAFLSFTNQGKNIFELQLKEKVKVMFKGSKHMELHKSAMDKSLIVDGKLDIFLRFIFGMLIKENQELLQPFLTSPLKWPHIIEDAAALIKKRMRDCQDADRKTNLQYCLVELGLSEA